MKKKRVVKLDKEIRRKSIVVMITSFKKEDNYNIPQTSSSTIILIFTPASQISVYGTVVMSVYVLIIMHCNIILHVVLVRVLIIFSNFNLIVPVFTLRTILFCYDSSLAGVLIMLIDYLTTTIINVFQVLIMIAMDYLGTLLSENDFQQ